MPLKNPRSKMALSFAICFAVFVFVTGLFLNRQLTNEISNNFASMQTDAAEDLVSILTKVVWEKHSAYLSNLAKLSHENIRNDPRINQIVKETNGNFADVRSFLKFKFYDINRRTILSSDVNQIGEVKRADHPGMKVLKSGKPFHEFINKKNFKSAAGNIDRVTLLSIYIPVKAQGEVVGIAHIFFDAQDGLAAQSAITRRTLPLFFLAGFLLLAASTLLIMRLERAKDAARNQMLQSAKLVALGEMAGEIAHEINNPLGVILGKANHLREEVTVSHIEKEKMLKDLEKIEQHTLRISRIVKGMRSLARDGTHDQFQPSLLSTIVEDTVSACVEKFRSRGIELRVSQIPMVDVYCQQIQICQVLMNLLNNSYDAVVGQKNAWVALEATVSSSSVTIAVTDSGNGIPDKVAQKMMQPFYTTKEIGKGTGLGLSLSRAIVEQHQGHFYYDSASIHTRFVMELPLEASANSKNDSKSA